MLCKATAGMGVPVSVSPCIGATCPFIIFESADIDSAVDGVIETAFKKKREVIYRNKCESVSHAIPSDHLRSSSPLLSLLRSTGCCACRRVCWTVLWPVSSSGWRAWSVWRCTVMETGSWWMLQYGKLNSRGPRLARTTEKSCVQPQWRSKWVNDSRGSSHYGYNLADGNQHDWNFQFFNFSFKS